LAGNDKGLRGSDSLARASFKITGHLFFNNLPPLHRAESGGLSLYLPPLHRPALGAEPGSLRLPRPLLRSGTGAVCQRGYADAGAGEPAGSESVRVR
jgi:hypothetical protein